MKRAASASTTPRHRKVAVDPTASTADPATPPATRKRKKWPRNIDERCHALVCLPFVQPGFEGQTGYDYWAPKPTGDHAYDCWLGAAYAEALVGAIRKDNGPIGLLQCVLFDIVDHADIEQEKGLLIGMFAELGMALAGRGIGSSPQSRAALQTLIASVGGTK